VGLLETCASPALNRDRGRRALYQQGDPETGPYQSALEDGMMQFHALPVAQNRAASEMRFFITPQRAAHTARFFRPPAMSRPQ